jgi:hypothetical protein
MKDLMTGRDINPAYEAQVLAGGITLGDEPAVLSWPRKPGSTTYGPCKLIRIKDGVRGAIIRDFRDQGESVVLALAELLEVDLERS